MCRKLYFLLNISWLSEGNLILKYRIMCRIIPDLLSCRSLLLSVSCDSALAVSIWKWSDDEAHAFISFSRFLRRHLVDLDGPSLLEIQNEVNHFFAILMLQEKCFICSFSLISRYYKIKSKLPYFWHVGCILYQTMRQTKWSKQWSLSRGKRIAMCVLQAPCTHWWIARSAYTQGPQVHTSQVAARWV